MEVRFRSRKLEKQYLQSSAAIKAYGVEVGRQYIQRINILKSTRNLEELKRLPGLDAHSLKGDRKGQWALSLTGYERLIFTPEGGQPETVRIEEVSKHYGD